MNLNNLVTCDECSNYNQQLNDCKAKNFEKIEQPSRCRNCDLYHPTVKKSFDNLIKAIHNH